MQVYYLLAQINELFISYLKIPTNHEHNDNSNELITIKNANSI